MEKTPSIGDRVRVVAPFEVHKLHDKGNATRHVRQRDDKDKKGRYFNGTIGGVPDSLRRWDIVGISVVRYLEDGSPDVEIIISDNFRVDLDDGGTVLVPEDKIEVL